MVLQGFGIGGQQGALDGGLSSDLSRVEMAEYEPHVARPAWRATKEGTFDFRLRFFFSGCFFSFWVPRLPSIKLSLILSLARFAAICPLAAAMSFLSVLSFWVSRPTLHIVRTATAFSIWVALGCVACL